MGFTPERLLVGAVWSEDGQELSYLEQRYEKSIDFLISQPKRNYFYALRSRFADGTGEKEINPMRPGEIVGPLYAMRCERYWLVPIRLEDGEQRIEMHKPQQVKTVARWLPSDGGCASVMMIPSPDGKIIGRLVVRGQPCSPLPPTKEVIEVDFFDAQKLWSVGAVEEARVGKSHRLEIQPSYGAFWRAIVDGKGDYSYRLEVSGRSQLWELDPQGPTPAARPLTEPLSCLGPRTSSSSVNAKGQLVEVRGDNLAIEPTADPRLSTFGCGLHEKLELRCGS